MDTGSLDKLHDITIKIIMHIYFLTLFLHVDDVFGSCGRLTSALPASLLFRMRISLSVSG